jgi:hypothetical protein
MRLLPAARHQDADSTSNRLMRGKPARLLEQNGARVVLGASVDAAGTVKLVAPGAAAMDVAP